MGAGLIRCSVNVSAGLIGCRVNVGAGLIWVEG